MCRGQLTSFLEDPEVLRLMIYMDGKELTAVRDSALLSEKQSCLRLTESLGCLGCEAPCKVQAQDGVLCQDSEDISQCREHQEERRSP